MSVITDLREHQWEQASLYGHQETYHRVNDDKLWNEVLRTKCYDWTRMDSSMWGDLAILIHIGLSTQNRKNQAEELSNIVISSLSY